MINDEVSRRVLGADSRRLTEINALRCFQWLRCILLMLTHRLPFRDVFAHAEQGWKKRRGGRAMNWRRSMKKLASELASVEISCPCGSGQKDENCYWLATLRDMA